MKECPYSSYAAGLSAAMEDLALLRRLAAAGLSEAIASATNVSTDSDGVHSRPFKTKNRSSELPYPAEVIVEARARLGSDYAWEELSQAQRQAACQRCLEENTMQDTKSDLTSSLHDQVIPESTKSVASVGYSGELDNESLAAPATGVRFEVRSDFEKDAITDPSREILVPDSLKYTADLVSASRMATGRARPTTAAPLAFILTSMLPAARRPSRNNKASLTPVAEARGQLPAIAPFLASVGSDEGSLCLWYDCKETSLKPFASEFICC